METLRQILAYKIDITNNFSFSVVNLLILIGIYLCARLAVQVATRLLRRRFERHTEIEEGRRFAIIKITKYLIFVLAILLMLANSGLDITVLLAGSTALFVGLGFGLQNTFKDFVCGVIMLFEGSLDVNDVVRLGEEIGRVTHIGLRTSKIMTPDGIFMIVPNSKFIEDTVVNFTKERLASRFKVSIGVAYGSDVPLVRKVLCELMQEEERILQNPPPAVRFKDFGDSALQFELMFWTAQNFLIEEILSATRYRIDAAFRDNNITIPFPQRDLHIQHMPPMKIPEIGSIGK